MATLVLRERVQHITVDGVHYTVVDAQKFRDEPDGDHPFMVARATSLLAAHYQRFIQLGGNTQARPSGLCRDHRVTRMFVVHGADVLATMDLEAA